METPCQDLAYTINNIAKAEDTVYLLSNPQSLQQQQNSRSTVFVVKEPLQIKHGETFYLKGVGNRGSKTANKIIITSPTTTTSTAVFNVALADNNGSKSAKTSIYLENLQLENVTLFEQKELESENHYLNLTMHLRHCVLTGSTAILTDSLAGSRNETLSKSATNFQPNVSTKTSPNHANISAISFDSITSLKQNDNTATITTTINIIDSVIDTRGCIISTTNSTSLMFLVIRDSTIKSGYMSSTNAYINLIVSNVTWDAGPSFENDPVPSSSGYLIHIKGEIDKKSDLDLEGLTIIGNYSVSSFLRCEKCRLRIKDVTFKGAILKNAMKLEETDADIKRIAIGSSASITDVFMYVSCRSHAVFKEIEISESDFRKHFAIINGSSNATFEILLVTKSHLSEQLLTSTAKSITEIHSIEITNSVIAYEMFRIREDAALYIRQISAHDSRFHQAVLALLADPKTQTSGRLRILRSVFHNNVVNSTFFGIVDADEFLLQNMSFMGNVAGDLFHSSKTKNVTLQDLLITGNEFKSGFIIQTSSIFLNRITYANNVAKGHGKALIYESSCNNDPQVNSFYIH